MSALKPHQHPEPLGPPGLGRSWGCLLLLVTLCGCVRLLAPAASQGAAATGLGGLGSGCTADNNCASGFCVQGLCCNTRCDGLENACNLPGTAGTCRTKTLGGPCSVDVAVSQCPTSAPSCVDGVCCETACLGACHSCNTPAAPGRCLPVPNNTKPDPDCPLTCTSCQDGACGNTSPGLDPAAECSSGFSCDGLGACAASLGQTCVASEHCANGTCIAGRCRSKQLESLPIPSLIPGIPAMSITSMDVGSDGRVILTAGKLFNYEYPTATPGPAVVAVERPDGQWRTTVLEPCSEFGDRLACVKQGTTYAVLHARAVDPDPQGNRCGIPHPHLVASILGQEGEFLDKQVIDINLKDLSGASIAAFEDGVLRAVATDANNQTKMLERRPGSNAWLAMDVPNGDRSLGSASIVEMQGIPVVLDFAVDEPQLRITVVRAPGVGETSRVSLPPDCAILNELSLTVLLDEARPQAQVSFTCDVADISTRHAPGLAILDLTQPMESRLSPAIFTAIPYVDGDPRTGVVISAAPVVLEGALGIMYSDKLGNVWLAYGHDGAWSTVAVSVFGDVQGNIRAQGLISHHSSHGSLTLWTLALEDNSHAFIGSTLLRSLIYP